MSRGNAVERERPAWVRGALWLLLIAVLAWVWWFQRGHIRIVPAERAPLASALVLLDLDGRRLELRDFAGRVVVVNLWASWCGPCRAEIPGFSRVSRELDERGVVVLGLNTEELPPRDMARLAEELGIAYPVVRPLGLSGTFEIPAVIPHTWIVDPAGRLRASHGGFVSGGALRKACLRLLEEGDAEGTAGSQLPERI